MLLRVEGIVIRSMDYGEGNKILTVFSREAGKLSVMARGAKKLKSRYTAASQLFTYGQFVIYKAGSMGTLNDAEIWTPFHRLREDIATFAYGAYLMELTERTIGESERNEPLFVQLKAALDALDEGKDPDIVLAVYEVNIIGIAGYMPVLNGCVSCGSVEGSMAFSSSMGGTLCMRCRGQDRSAIALSEGALKLLRLFLRLDLRRLGKTDVKPETKRVIKQCIRHYMDTYIDIKWKSRHFLDQMDKYGI